MKAYKYRFLLRQLIAALDTGNYDSLDIHEVRRHAKAGTISAFLIDHFGVKSDFSIFEAQDWAAISEDMTNLANAVDARRKFEVENKGISLLMAYTLQALQSMESDERKAAG
jgi:uncharacterized protein (DUF1697 family)